jgi:uncharacterized protein YbaR (Trm112 family)
MDLDGQWMRKKSVQPGDAERLLVPASQFLNCLLTCPECKARGAMTWERDAGDRDSYSSLVRLSGGFHIEEGRTSPVSKTIVCTQCDEIYGPLPSAGKLPTGAQ